MMTGSAPRGMATSVGIASGEVIVISTLNGSYGTADLFENVAGTPLLSTIAVPAGGVMAIGPYATSKRVVLNPQQGGDFSYVYGRYLRPTRRPSNARPIVSADDLAFYFDTTLNKELYWNAPHWFDTGNNQTQVADVTPIGLPKEIA